MQSSFFHPFNTLASPLPCLRNSSSSSVASRSSSSRSGPSRRPRSASCSPRRTCSRRRWPSPPRPRPSPIAWHSDAAGHRHAGARSQGVDSQRRRGRHHRRDHRGRQRHGGEGRRPAGRARHHRGDGPAELHPGARGELARINLDRAKELLAAAPPWRSPNTIRIDAAYKQSLADARGPPGADRQEARARPVRRPYRHPAGERRPVYFQGPRPDAAPRCSTRSSSTSACRSRQLADLVGRSEALSVTVDAFHGKLVCRRDLGDQLRGRCGHAQHLRAGHDREPPGGAPLRHVRPGGGRAAPRGRPAIVLPATAIIYAPYGNSVFIVEKMKDPGRCRNILGVRQQIVKLGDTRGDLVAIDEGIKRGRAGRHRRRFQAAQRRPGAGEQRAPSRRASATPKPANT